MKRIWALILVMLLAVTALCGCGNTGDTPNDNKNVSATNNAADNKVGGTVEYADLPDTYEIAATEPHYIFSVPDWRAEGYGYGFALNEKGNKKYAIVTACDDSMAEESLNEAFQVLYNDTFNSILVQNYRAKYAEFTPETTEVTLKDGTSALLFNGVQPADDYGTEMNCPVYGYGFMYNGVTFIVAYIVIDESSADDAKRSQMKGYVDEMVNTVRAAG